MRLFTTRISSFLRNLGFKTIVYPELLPQKKMAQLAGMGNFGKNTLVVNPRYGPWIRLHSVLTDAEMVFDKPFEMDLCGDCLKCVKACPVGALKPYVVDPDKCLLGIDDFKRKNPEIKPIFDKYVPRITRNSYLMCMACQRACPYGKEERGLV
jgi:epoxyqueuosine reductase